MSLVVTGSIGLDTVQTPHGEVKDVLGGSAVYFAFSASLFTPVRLVGAVGEDFPEHYRSLFRSREIDLAGLETREGSQTFRWSGRYQGDMNEAETLTTELNVLAEDAPPIPSVYKDSKFIFLAATHPQLQQDAAAEFPEAELIVCDTRDLWIETQKKGLIRTLNQVQGVMLNDSEARMFTGEVNLITAGRLILGYGPEFVIIKKGEHGAMLLTKDQVLALPAYPTDKVRDPTGAGDSFAGGMMGYLAGLGQFDVHQVHRAMVYGTVTASLTIEDFSLDSIAQATRPQVDERYAQYLRMLSPDG